MRLLMLALLGLLLAGCDRQKGQTPQGGEAPSGWAGPKTAEPAQSHPTGRLDRSHAGTAAPAGLFEDPDGEPASLADFRGKPVLVNLWATWCGPCKVEMPSLDALAAREAGVKVLTVSQDADGRDKVDAYFAQNGFRRLESYLDPQLGLMMELRVDTLPTTILYDGAGKEVWRMTGMEDWEGARAAGLLREATS